VALARAEEAANVKLQGHVVSVSEREFSSVLGEGSHGTQTIEAGCPNGSVVSDGGFSWELHLVEGGSTPPEVLESGPNGNGWSVELNIDFLRRFDKITVKVYALCLTPIP
jgi:hypothetical protein